MPTVTHMHKSLQENKHSIDKLTLAVLWHLVAVVIIISE